MGNPLTMCLIRTLGNSLPVSDRGLVLLAEPPYISDPTRLSPCCLHFSTAEKNKQA